MDHAISDLKERLRAFMEVYAGEDTIDVIDEMAAYVTAIRILETQHYGEARAELSVAIQVFERGE